MFANRLTVDLNPDFVLQDFEPAYMQAYQRGELQERAELASLAAGQEDNDVPRW
ncbi:MAG: hypothetical protein V3W03_04340 [Gammaproteobacteria bacterium]